MLESLDFAGKIVCSMVCKSTASDALLRLKNKWGSRGRWFESSHSDQENRWFYYKTGGFSYFSGTFVPASSQVDPNIDPNNSDISLQIIDLFAPLEPRAGIA